jgi:enoyl-ACP reductase-like protein
MCSRRCPTGTLLRRADLVDLRGAFLCDLACRLHRHGAGDDASGAQPAYSASKWALEGLSRSAAYVYADWGIRCNVIQPGFIETDMTAQINSSPLMRTMSQHTMSNTILLRRTGKAEEIATTALFLASDDSSYITGTDIVVDGGWFSSAPYLGNERSHHMLTLLKRRSRCRNSSATSTDRP